MTKQTFDSSNLIISLFIVVWIVGWIAVPSFFVSDIVPEDTPQASSPREIWQAIGMMVDFMTITVVGLILYHQNKKSNPRY